MLNLEHIDLTENKRFERIVNDEEWNKKKIVDQGIHRLKRGEIPHVSVSNPPYTITTTTISPWITTSDIDTNNRWTSNIPTTTTSFTVHSYVTRDNDEFSWSNLSSWIVSADSTSNTLDEFNVTWFDDSSITLGSSFNSSSDISDRIKYNPFKDSIVYSSDSIGSRIKNTYNDDYDTYIKPRDGIIHRIDDETLYFHTCHSDKMYRSSILIRLGDNDESDYISYHERIWTRDHINTTERQFKNLENLLKERAPFIKRIYVTNGGHSFDRTELSLDMAIAEEHLNSALSNP